jgi:hypothetical protein
VSTKMFIVDELGLIKTEPNSIKPIESDHPVWKARNSLALGRGEWLYAPDEGHGFINYRNQKATSAKIEGFQKEVALYLEPYGPEVVDRILSRGTSGTSIKITKETISG